ncbi:hypothetical protein LB533_03410 [Mesorhizobium sp. BR1-1-13]|uniref:hypothetical protein n=1 Tax=Mesorhizobium sp. BR1-1-13 TaxID=2876656 RepID=UPI001CD15BA2|nr:hypothetical protein [Mesorhizobium sp. BR1-1-13]MBZ9940147.1 hypothetical protein [Mesorhizobium sp. BR1-1-13]
MEDANQGRFCGRCGVRGIVESVARRTDCTAVFRFIGYDGVNASKEETTVSVLIDRPSVRTSLADQNLAIYQDDDSAIAARGVAHFAKVDFFFNAEFDRISGKTTIMSYSNSRSWVKKSTAFRVTFDGEEYALAMVYELNNGYFATSP